MIMSILEDMVMCSKTDKDTTRITSHSSPIVLGRGVRMTATGSNTSGEGDGG